MKLQSKIMHDTVSRQHPLLQGVNLICSSYLELDIPSNSLIYCDPPYRGTTSYADRGFNHDLFWDWCRKKTDEGHKVFVSEYNAPKDFECVWEKKVNNTLVKDTGSKQGIEKLFTIQ